MYSLPNSICIINSSDVFHDCEPTTFDFRSSALPLILIYETSLLKPWRPFDVCRENCQFRGQVSANSPINIYVYVSSSMFMFRSIANS